MYRMRFTSLFGSTSQQQPNTYWSPDEIQIMETFFNNIFFPLSSQPILTMPSIDMLSFQASQNSHTAMGSFERMLSIIQPRILKDLVKVIRLEQVSSNH